MPDREREVPALKFTADREKKVLQASQNGVEQKQVFHPQSHLALPFLQKDREQWVRHAAKIGKMLKKYILNSNDEKTNAMVKVAVIDDGVMLDHPSIELNIEAGETFYRNDDGSWPGWYQSTHGHGTQMALLICEMCPHVKLYIAKLDEKLTNGSLQITADSAANAIDWARRDRSTSYP